MDDTCQFIEQAVAESIQGVVLQVRGVTSHHEGKEEYDRVLGMQPSDGDFSDQVCANTQKWDQGNAE